MQTPTVAQQPAAGTTADSPEQSGQGRRKVVLAGNPNVGKSLFFNYLSGMYVDVSNFPGTTVSVSKGIYKEYDIFDTPGIYGVSSFNDEERVASEMILQADVLINIVNSLHLERDLFLTQQLIDLGKPVAVFLNFSDELNRQKIKVDTAKLAVLLGVPVYLAAAVDRQGFDKLDEAITAARQGVKSKPAEALSAKYLPVTGNAGEALLLAEGDETTTTKYKHAGGTGDDREELYVERRGRVNEIISQVEYEDSNKGRFFNLLGRYSLHPLTGLPLLAIVLVGMYFFIGDLVAQRLVDFTENTIGHRIFEYNMKSYVAGYTSAEITVDQLNPDESVKATKKFKFTNGSKAEPEKESAYREFSGQGVTDTHFYFPNPFVRLFFGEFGVVSMTITYLLFLLLPLVLAFYFSMAALEDSGYLPRLATMMDRSLMHIGLNGRAIIPLLLGFGCVTMATITTRILGSEREKTIATAILQFVIPCSAQLSVVAVLLSTAGPKALFIYVVVIVTVLLVLSTLLHRLLPGQSTPLLIDLPFMRLPRLDNVLKKTFHRTVGFMREAAVWFFVGAFLVGLLEATGLLYSIQDVLAPLTVYWMKLPKETATAFIMGVVRRDFGAAGLFSIPLSVEQITVSIITITLFVPCIASFMVMLNERGWKEGLIIWAGTWIGAFTIGGIVARIIM